MQERRHTPPVDIVAMLCDHWEFLHQLPVEGCIGISGKIFFLLQLNRSDYYKHNWYHFSINTNNIQCVS